MQQAASRWFAGAVALTLCACAHEDGLAEDGLPEDGLAEDGLAEDKEVGTISSALNANQTAGVGSVSWEYIADNNYTHLTDRLGSLVGHGVTLTINVPTTQMYVESGPTSPWPAIKKAIELNIPVTLWLTLPEFPTPMSTYPNGGENYRKDPYYKSTGYFANQSNAAAYVSWADHLKTAFEKHHPGKKAGILIDMEMRKELMKIFPKPTDNPADQVTFFRRYGGLDRATEYNEALNIYKTFVTKVRNAGWRIDVSTFVQFLDDYADGDGSIRRAYGAVLDDPRVAGATPWSHVYFQAYTTLYAPVTNYFVYDYARLARSIFGAAAAIDVGLTHGGIDPNAPLYWGSIPLAQDTSAALAAGIPRGSIEVYSYLGMFYRPYGAGRINDNIESWFFPVPPINLPPVPDPGTAAIHAVFRTLDLAFPAQ